MENEKKIVTAEEVEQKITEVKETQEQQTIERKEDRDFSEQKENRNSEKSATEFKQISGIVSQIQAQSSDDASTNSPSDDTFTDIPGKTPEEKILYLLNEFPINRAKEVVDELEDPSHFGELHENR